MNILFRADSSSNIGTGHIMRDLVLAERDFSSDKVIFCIQDLEGNINQKIEEAGYEIEILNSNNIDELISIIKKLNINMLVIDHYDINHHDEKKLKTENPKLTILSFDDTYEKHYCDILLNHNIYADENRYENLVPFWCDIRCGSQYTLIRKEFVKEEKLTRIMRYDILLAMGGADTTNINIKILDMLPKHLKIAVLSTSANKYLEALKDYVNYRDNIYLFVNYGNVARIINESKISVITPSVMANELIFMRKTFVAIKIIKNQSYMYSYLLKRGYRVLNKLSKVSLEQSINIRSLTNFINLTFDEKKMILEWRNNEEVRKWMFSQTKINLANHLKFIDTLSYREDGLYFLVREAGYPVGVIDFTSISKSNMVSEVGLYANPKLKGKGELLMQEILQYGFNVLKLKTLVAKFLSSNTRASSLYAKFNFKVINVNKQIGIVSMELSV